MTACVNVFSRFGATVTISVVNDTAEGQLASYSTFGNHFAVIVTVTIYSSLCFWSVDPQLST